MLFVSLPSWERGLKSENWLEPLVSAMVAPLVGAWIEMIIQHFKSFLSPVAPLVGAWIEI